MNLQDNSLKTFGILLALLILSVGVVLAVFVLHPARIFNSGSSSNSSVTSSVNHRVTPAREKVTVEQIRRISEITAVEDLNSFAATPDGRVGFLPSFDENKVYVLDLKRDVVEDVVRVEFPFAVELDSSNSRFYVATGVNPRLIEYNLETRVRLRDLRLPAIPYDLKLDPQEGRLFVSHNLANQLSVVDLKSFRVMKTFGVGETPRSLALKGRRLYVTNFGEGSLSVVSAVSLTELTRLKLPGRPNRVLADPLRDRLYVSESFGNQVLVIDTRTGEVSAHVAVDEFPYGLDIDSRAESLYVTGYARNTLSVVDLRSLTLTRVIETSAAFQGQAGFNLVKLLEDQRKLYLINSLNGKVLVYTF